MTDDKIQRMLAEVFTPPDGRPGPRVVFWQDDDGSAGDNPEDLLPDGVQLIRLAEASMLEVKVRVELDEPGTRFLLYATTPDPDPLEDWLLDMRLYGRTFRADLAEYQREELGLLDPVLHAHMQARSAFLANKQRMAKLKRLVHASDSAAEVDIKMMAVCCGIEDAELDSVVMALATAAPADDILAASHEVWQDFERYDLTAPFWEAARARYGIQGMVREPADLYTHLLMTDWAATTASGSIQDIPAPLRHLVVIQDASWTRISVLCSHWRAHTSRSGAYRQVAHAVAARIGLSEQLDSESWSVFLGCQTFLEIEQLIIRSLREILLHNPQGEAFATVEDAIDRRRVSYWAENGPYAAIYASLEAARSFLALKRTYDAGFGASDLPALAAAYAQDIYRFDRYYRECLHEADRVEQASIDVLKPLRGAIERLYTEWYLVHLAQSWDHQVAATNWMSEGGIAGLSLQTRFFHEMVRPLLDINTRTRVVVIVSDALRYEAGKALAYAVNGASGVVAEVEPMLSTLPSYTRLGMAALLPHRELTYGDQGQVLVDGKRADGLDARHAILQGHGGMALRAHDLLEMRGTDARALVKDARVVYIYHDHIDAIGDKRATETKTFAAVHTTIEELANLAQFVLKNLNVTHVLVTADHGFLYQDSEVAETEQTRVEVPPGTVMSHKRFILGKDLGEHAQVWAGTTAATAGMPVDQALDFWLPKGVNRFNLQGGARFIHGGAMPQEAIVPVVHIAAKRGAQADTAQVRPVGLTLLTSLQRVVNSRQAFSLLQNEPVSDKIRPRTVVVCILDGERVISDHQTLVLDGASDNVNELRRDVTLTIDPSIQGKHPHCYVVIRDTATQIEVLRHPLIVDISFAREF